MAVTEYKNKNQKSEEQKKQKSYGQMLKDYRRPDKKVKSKK